MEFDFDESVLYCSTKTQVLTPERTPRLSTAQTEPASVKEKKKPKVNHTITVKNLEDCFVELYVQDYFESRNNSIFRKFIREVYKTAYDISSFFKEIKNEAFKDKPKNDKLWYKKYKS